MRLTSKDLVRPSKDLILMREFSDGLCVREQDSHDNTNLANPAGQ